MLEKYGFYMIAAGGLAAIVALVWLMIRTVRKCPTVGPLRLLIAAADYRHELRVGKTILDQSSEMYRKLRNTPTAIFFSGS